MPYIGNTSADRFVAAKAATQFSGDGSTVAFTLEHSVGSDEDILVSVDGVVQEPSVAYAVSNGTTLTFTAAPSSNSGNNIFVYYLFRTVGTVSHPSNNALEATSATFSGDVTIPDKIIHSGDTNTAIRFPDADTVSFETGGSERARVDSNGSILVGTTSNDSANLGARMKSTGRVDATTNGGVCSIITRLSNDGTLVQFKKDTTTVGTIQSNGGVTIDIDGGGDIVGLAFTGDSLLPRKNGSLSYDTNNLGDGSRRFDNIHATNGTIQTSDRNEKQDIE